MLVRPWTRFRKASRSNKLNYVNVLQDANELLVARNFGLGLCSVWAVSLDACEAMIGQFHFFRPLSNLPSIVHDASPTLPDPFFAVHNPQNGTFSSLSDSPDSCAPSCLSFQHQIFISRWRLPHPSPVPNYWISQEWAARSGLRLLSRSPCQISLTRQRWTAISGTSSFNQLSRPSEA